MQVGCGGPDAIKRRGHVAALGHELGGVFAAAKPALVKPLEKVVVTRVTRGVGEERIGAHFFQGDKEVGVGFFFAIGAVTLGAVLVEDFFATTRKGGIQCKGPLGRLDGFQEGEHMAELGIDFLGLAAVVQGEQAGGHHDAPEIAAAHAVVEHGVFLFNVPPRGDVGGDDFAGHGALGGFVPLEGVGVAMEGEDGGDLVSGINTAGGSDKGGPSDAHGAAEWLIGTPLGRVGPVQRLHRAVDQRKKRALIERKIQVGVAEAEDELAIDASGVAVHAVGADNGRAVGRLDGSEVVGHAAVDAGALELIAGQQRVRGTKHANGHTGVDVVAIQQIALAGIGIARSLWRGRDGSGARRMRARRRPCLCRLK